MSSFTDIEVSLNARYTKSDNVDFIAGFPDTMKLASAQIVYKNEDIAVAVFDHCGDRFSFGGSIGSGFDTNGTFDLENDEYCVFIDIISSELDGYQLTSVSHGKRSSMLYLHHEDFWDRCFESGKNNT